MNRTFAIVAVAALSLVWGTPFCAQLASAATAPVSHVLVSTFFDQGEADAELSKIKTFYTFGDVTSITCNVACTIEVEEMLEVGENKSAENFWSGCAAIDGKSSDLVCVFQGALPTDTSYVIGNYTWSVSLTKGTHTLQPTAIVETGPAVVAYYHMTYHVYEP
jgi:hypothetical protein